MEKLRPSPEHNFEKIPQEYLSMYEVSGHERPTERSFQRYFDDKKRWDGEMRLLALPIQRVRNIPQAPEYQRAHLVRDALQSPLSIVREYGMRAFHSVPLQERADLSRYVLSSDDVVLRRQVIDLLVFLPPDIRGHVVHKALQDPDIVVQEIAATSLEHVAPQDILSLRVLILEKIHLALKSPDARIRIRAVNMIPHVGKSERTRLLDDTLKDSDIFVQYRAAQMIQIAPENDRNSLRAVVAENIRRDFKNSDIEVQKHAVKMIVYAPENERTVFVRQALCSSDIEIQKQAAKAIVDTVTFWVHESALFCLRSAKIQHLSMLNRVTMVKKTSGSLREVCVF